MQATIVQVCETLGRGGFENVVRDLALNCDSQQFRTHVLCRIEGGHTATALREEGVPVHILNHRRFTPGAFKDALRRISSDESPLIVHGHGLMAVSSEMIYSRFLGAKGVIVHAHNVETPLIFRQIVKIPVLKRCTDQFIAVADLVSSSLQGIGISNVTTIRNGTDLSRWTFVDKPEREPLTFPSDAFVLGMVGRVVKRKGFDLFLDIIENIENVYGLIVGDGDYYPEVKRLMEERNLTSRIKCVGWQTDLQNYYQLLDALFLYSTAEGGPLVVIESQAVGVPYLGNVVGVVEDVVQNGRNGYLLRSKSLPEIGKRIQDIREKSDTLRENCRSVIEKKFLLEQQIQATEDLYRSMLS